jgi:hypothetical protein
MDLMVKEVPVVAVTRMKMGFRIRVAVLASDLLVGLGS